MTIEQIIEKGIKGGWKPLKNVDFEDKSGFGIKNIIWDLPCIVLRPEVWQAVGKIEGWKHQSAYCKVGNHKSCRRNDETCQCFHHKMHQMIDALCEGKSISDFIKTL